MSRTRVEAPNRPASESHRRPPNRLESLTYTHEMLVSLRKLSILQGEKQLMRLIEAAAAEALALTEREPA